MPADEDCEADDECRDEGRSDHRHDHDHLCRGDVLQHTDTLDNKVAIIHPKFIQNKATNMGTFERN